MNNDKAALILTDAWWEIKWKKGKIPVKDIIYRKATGSGRKDIEKNV